MLLEVINSSKSDLVSIFRDDPVRPEISAEFRCIQPNNSVFVLRGYGGENLAVLCCSFKDYVPCSMDQLLYTNSKLGSNAIFYSVWSYSKGSGRQIIPLVQEWIKGRYSNVVGFYTYSPKGLRVQEFHISLGARVYRENVDSINYVYN